MLDSARTDYILPNLKTLGAFFLDDCGPHRTRTAFRHCERLVLANYTMQPI